MLWIILIIVVICILQILSYTRIEMFEENKEIEIPESHVDNMYDLTRYMDNFFKKHDIPYWIIGGTLIGALRNTPPGPIKWDDDLDVAILKQDEKKFQHALKTDVSFQNLVEWCDMFFGASFKLKGKEKGYKEYYYDVFVYDEHDGKFGKKLYTGGEYDIFHKYYYNDLDEIFPLKDCQFWDLALPCPNNLDTVHRGYDCDVLKFAQKYNHTTENNEKIDITKNINRGDTIPLLSSRLAKKLTFNKMYRHLYNESF